MASRPLYLRLRSDSISRTNSSGCSLVTSGRPLVCPMSIPTVMRSAFGMSGSHRARVSFSVILPSSTSFSTRAPTNVLVMLAIENRPSGRIGVSGFRSSTPDATATSPWPGTRMATLAPKADTRARQASTVACTWLASTVRTVEAVLSGAPVGAVEVVLSGAPVGAVEAVLSGALVGAVDVAGTAIADVALVVTEEARDAPPPAPPDEHDATSNAPATAAAHHRDGRTAHLRRDRRAGSASVVGERSVSRHRDADAALVAQRAFTHAVHHVGDHESRVEVDDDDGSAPSTPEAGARVGTERHLLRVDAEADAQTQLCSEHEVDAAGLPAEHG